MVSTRPSRREQERGVSAPIRKEVARERPGQKRERAETRPVRRPVLVPTGGNLAAHHVCGGLASTTAWSEPGCLMILFATDRNTNSPFDMNGNRVETRDRDRNTPVDPKLAPFGIPPIQPARARTNCHEQYWRRVLRHRVLVVPFTTKARKADRPSNRKERAAMHARG